MKHDPMCPMTTPDGYLCCCNLIARVREDERKQYAAKWYSQQELDDAVAAAREEQQIISNALGFKLGKAAGVKAARDAVAALMSPPSDKDPTPLDFAIYEEVLPAIDALSEEGRNTG